MDIKNTGTALSGNKAQDTMDTIKHEGERYANEAKERLEEFKDKAEDKGRELKERWDNSRKSADEYARKNPWQVAGLAALVGAVAALTLTSCLHRSCKKTF